MAAPRLSVVTRTRGRNLLLRRAGQGLKASLPAGSEWIIVCDDPVPDGSVELLVQSLGLGPDVAVKIVETRGIGRPEALNAGLDAATGTYLHFHDDDDTVEPGFYARTLDFLDADPRYGAVVTWVERRSETVEGDIIRPLAVTPHNPGLRTITFAQLASACLFPPIAFVARRERALETGRFDRALDVAEDYDFFLRFLAIADIGVIAERLCAVHVRPAADPADALANSRASDAYEEVDALYRNAKFRQDLATGELGLGWLLLIGELAKTTTRVDAILGALRKAPLFGRLRKMMQQR